MTKWIEWLGGECPIPDGQLVEIRFRNGDALVVAMAGAWQWWHSGKKYDVVAYREVEVEIETDSNLGAVYRADRGSLSIDGKVFTGVETEVRARRLSRWLDVVNQQEQYQ